MFLLPESICKVAANCAARCAAACAAAYLAFWSGAKRVSKLRLERRMPRAAFVFRAGSTAGDAAIDAALHIHLPMACFPFRGGRYPHRITKNPAAGSAPESAAGADSAASRASSSSCSRQLREQLQYGRCHLRGKLLPQPHLFLYVKSMWDQQKFIMISVLAKTKALESLQILSSRDE